MVVSMPAPLKHCLQTVTSTTTSNLSSTRSHSSIRRHKDTRPLLRTPDPKATLAALYQERLPVYRMADLGVEARAEYTVETMAAHVLDALKTRPDVLELSR